MFVISVKASKLKWWGLAGVGILAVILLISSAFRRPETAETAAGVSVIAETNAQRRAFLTEYGWEVAEDPSEIREILLPAEFNETYEAYNALQKSQGFDLTPYRGDRVKLWVYPVNNHPNQTDPVIATLLIRNGKIIGGDISSQSADGFRHGFDRNSAQSQSFAPSEEKNSEE